MDLIVILGILFFSMMMEIVDSSLGMMYGTILSPILVGLGYSPLLVVPAILLSQALGGIGGTISHHKFKNADFKGLTRDTKVALAMIIPGLFVVSLGVFIAANLSKLYVSTYIGLLVVVMGVLVLTPLKYKFAWWKHYFIGILASFNKSLSGGGFGPVTSTGGIIGGVESKVSIATTTFAEVAICLASFTIYVIYPNKLNYTFVGVLCAGAVIGGLIGPYISSKVNHTLLRKVIGVFGILSGIWLLWQLYA